MTFKSQVRQFRNKSLDKVDAIYRASIRDLIEAATVEQPGVAYTGGTFEVGKIPVDTRELVESLYVSINSGKVTNALSRYRRVIDRVKATDTVSFGFDADHAYKMEFGDGEVEGRFFVTKATNRWYTFVNQNAARLRK